MHTNSDVVLIKNDERKKLNKLHPDTVFTNIYDPQSIEKPVERGLSRVSPDLII